ncbi:MAG: threonine/serine exporter family protein [Bacteroidales bacterium]
MEIIYTILFKVIWSGVAAAGFGILFNIPNRTIIPVFSLGAIAGLIKFSAIHLDVGIIIASFIASGFVGFASIPFSSKKHTSPFVLSIPSIIPMIPGYYGYKTLLGVVKLALSDNIQSEQTLFFSATQNGLRLFFILLVLTIGISLPWLALRKKVRRKLLIDKAEDLVQ